MASTHTHTCHGEWWTLTTVLASSFPPVWKRNILISFANSWFWRSLTFCRHRVNSFRSQMLSAISFRKSVLALNLEGSKFKFKVTVKSKGVQIPATIGQDVHFPFQGIPVDAKLISSREFVEMGKNGEKMPFNESTFGVFWSQ